MDIAKTRHEDRTISRVLWCVKEKKKPNFEDKQRELRGIRRYLREWNKLHAVDHKTEYFVSRSTDRTAVQV